MWILNPLESGGQTHYLLSGKNYVVGRKNCDILLSNDQSISRAHAQLTVTDQGLTLNDTSKYGTFVNNQQLTAPVNLKSGDNVTFGVFHSKFSLSHEKLVVCTSCLDVAGKYALSETLAALDGRLVNTWKEECTHLVMPTVKVTIKTISALLCCCPIVRPEFFLELNNAFQQKLPPPKADSFVPEIDEPILNTNEAKLGLIPARKQLFEKKTFIFLSAKQYKRLSGAVSFAKGRSHLLEEGSLPRDLLESPQSCVVDIITNSSQTQLLSCSLQWANSVKSILQSKGFRLIMESEIGLAAIYASCDKYCNPLCLDIGFDQTVKPRIPSASLSQSVAVDETVLAAPSQNITAYAANTEPTQSAEVFEMSKLVAVGETPKKDEKNSQFHDSKFIVPDSMSSSFNNIDRKSSQREKVKSKASELPDFFAKIPPSLPKANDELPKRLLPNKFAQKSKNSAQVSPQKQSTLISFFQPVSKKRPLQDETSAVMSKSKRPTLESSITSQPSETVKTEKEMSSPPHNNSQTVPDTPPQYPVDLFEGPSKASAEKPQSKKRKEMKEKIQLPSLLENSNHISEEIDQSDNNLSKNQDQHKQPITNNSVVSSSSNKKHRAHHEENISKESPKLSVNGVTSFNINQIKKSVPPELHPNNIKEIKTEYSKLPESPSARTSWNKNSFVDGDYFFIDVKKEKTKTFPEINNGQKEDEIKPLITPKSQASTTENTLPQKLTLVEFRSLTVSDRQTSKLKQAQENESTKNFKCFRKQRLPGQDDVSHIITGSDLQVHNKVKNAEMNEWMRNTAEEESQNKRDQSLGDDLFRYNPTQLTKRR